MHKKAPSTLVDDCIDKFRQHEVERKRLRLLNGQRGSAESASVEFLMGGDPLSSALNESIEKPEGPGVEDMTGSGGKGLMQKVNTESVSLVTHNHTVDRSLSPPQTFCSCTTRAV